MCGKRWQFPSFFRHIGPIYLSGELFHLQSLKLKRWAVKDEVGGEEGSTKLLSGQLHSAGFSPRLLMTVGAPITEASLRSGVGTGLPADPVPPSSINLNH